MGLLDDAIREHLDLKRRRGADPTEVERQEREALGPVRRNRDPGDLEAAEPPIGAGDALPADDPGYAAGAGYPGEEAGYPAENGTYGDEPAYAEEERPYAGEPLAYADEPPTYADEPPPYADEPPAYRDEANRGTGVGDGFDEPPGTAAPAAGWTYQEPEERPGEEPPARPPVADHLLDQLEQETAEYHVAPGEDDDDMLEETPEFLQDTPDHDRLWFEQRPPRDFDFDN